MAMKTEETEKIKTVCISLKNRNEEAQCISWVTGLNLRKETHAFHTFINCGTSSALVWDLIQNWQMCIGSKWLNMVVQSSHPHQNKRKKKKKKMTTNCGNGKDIWGMILYILSFYIHSWLHQGQYMELDNSVHLLLCSNLILLPEE